MKYDEITKTFVATTYEEIQSDLINLINALFKPSVAYDSTNIKATMWYMVIQAVAILMQKMDTIYLAYQSEITKQFLAMQKEIELNSVGMLLGIRNNLTSLSFGGTKFIDEVGLSQPTNIGQRAIFGLAIKHNDTYLSATIENKLAMDTITANLLGIYVGVSIFTDPENATPYKGVISTGQEMDFYWQEVIIKPIKLLYEYNLESGKIMPDLTVLKQNLRDAINAEFKIGDEFKPQKYAKDDVFRMFDRQKLFYSEDNGETFKDINVFSKHFEKWTFNDNDIIFTNKGNTPLMANKNGTYNFTGDKSIFEPKEDVK